MRLNLMPTFDEIKSGKVTIEDLRKKILEKKPQCKCQRKNFWLNTNNNLIKVS